MTEELMNSEDERLKHAAVGKVEVEDEVLEKLKALTS